MSLGGETDVGNEDGLRAKLKPGDMLRQSVTTAPADKPTNSKDDTQGETHHKLGPGDDLEVTCTAKRDGS